MIVKAFFFFLILLGLYGLYLIAFRRKQMGFWMLMACVTPFWICFIGLLYKIIYQKSFEAHCYGEGWEEQLRSFHIHCSIISVIWGLVSTCIISLILYLIFRLLDLWKKLEPITSISLLVIFLLVVVLTFVSGYFVYLID